ncbi:MAG: hypothetical protein ACREFP_21800 [Acetobacteraceae bacterium]
MSRVAVQTDLFAPEPPASPPAPDPVAELTDLLGRLRAARTAPWPDATAAMAEEHRVLGLARQAGEKGALLAEAILRETERLLSAAD